MSPLETVWRPLVQRRLLPVAILLIAALVAVPLLLAKDPEPVAPVAPAPVAAGGESPTAAEAGTESVVSLVGEGEPAKRRRVLGASKNPFEPGPAPRAAKAETKTVTQEPPSAIPAGDSTSGSGGSVTTGGATPIGGSVTPPAAAPPLTTGPPAPPKPRHELYSLTVRFGDSSADSLEKMNLARLKALPSAEDPILVYLGVGDDEKTAVFMVDAAVEPQGDGTCRPSPANCETIHLRRGDTEFFDVRDEEGNVSAQYQLDLLKIERSTTTSAAKAKASRARQSKAGRKLLRARVAEVGPLRYRFNARKGTVERLDTMSFEAAVAGAAAAVAGAFHVGR